jgi:hypothetical protein
VIWCIILPVGERHGLRDDGMNGGVDAPKENTASLFRKNTI